MRRLFLSSLFLGCGAIALASMTNFGGGGGGSSFNGGTITNQLTLSGSTLTVTGSQFSVGGSTFVVTGGLVGVGTSAPAYTLDVYGNINTTGTITASGSSSSIISPNSSLPMGAGNGSAAITLFTSSFSAVGQSTFTVAAAGLVGVGTSAPSQRLTVTGITNSGTNTSNAILLTSSSTLVQLILDADDLAGGFISFGSNSAHSVEFKAGGAIKGNINTSGGWRLGDSTPAGTFVGLDVSTGTFKLPRYSSAQELLLTATGTGEMIFNTTIAVPCISTGTGAGGFVKVSSMSVNCQ